jgi:hypothetical protein
MAAGRRNNGGAFRMITQGTSSSVVDRRPRAAVGKGA